MNGNLANLGRGDVDRQDGAPVPLSDAESPQFDIDADEFPTERNEQFEAIEESLIENARSGLVPETISCLATLTKTDDAVAEHCLFNAKPSALFVLCKAYDLSSSALLALLEIRQSIDGDASLNTVSLLRRYESMLAHIAKRIFESTRSRETKKEAG